MKNGQNSEGRTAELGAFMEQVRGRNPNEPEFHQAVEEVVATLLPFVADHSRYRDANLLERLTEPDRVISFRVPWEDDSGAPRTNRGYRVQFNNAIGPYKGGLRFHPSVNQSILKFLGFEQILKNSLTGLPMGGGKGGATFDPKGKSDREIMRFCQSFMTELQRHIGADTDVPAGDIGVGGREVGFLFGQYKRVQNRFTGVLTGKALPFGGSLIRPEATGFGTVYFAQNMLETRGDSMSGKTVTISGSGNVATFAAQKCIEIGAKVLTLSDSGGTVYDKEGITQEKLAWAMELKNERRGRIKEYAENFGCEFREGLRPWSVACDVALPCATQNEVSLDDARTLIKNGVKVVSEGANMPTELAGSHAFVDAQVLYGPAKAANAGGVAVSGLEQSQNAIRLSWSREEVDERLQTIMRDIHSKCCEYGASGGDKSAINYVQGANLAGFVKVADAMLAQGVV